MRSFILAALLCVALVGTAQAGSNGRVLAADPQLLDSYRISAQEGVRERDVFNVLRDGQKIAEAIVVRVEADHSVVMVRGNAKLQANDEVVFVRHAPAAPAPAKVTTTTAPKTDYKIVGQRSLVVVNYNTIPGLNITTSPTTHNFSFQSTQFQQFQITNFYVPPFQINPTSYNTFSIPTFRSSTFTLPGLGLP